MEYMMIISTTTTTRNTTASILLLEKYRAAIANANIISCNIIRTGMDTGIDAFGAMKVPQKIATRRGAPIPNKIFMNQPLFK